MRDRRVPVQTHREATDGRPRSSRFYADVLAPQGLEQEVQMVFRGPDRLARGACTLARAVADFTDDKTAALAAVLWDVAEGLRGALFRVSVAAAAACTDGPAVAWRLQTLDGGWVLVRGGLCPTAAPAASRLSSSPPR